MFHKCNSLDVHQLQAAFLNSSLFSTKTVHMEGALVSDDSVPFQCRLIVFLQ